MGIVFSILFSRRIHKMKNKKIEIELINGDKVVKVSMESPEDNDIISLFANAFTFLDAEINTDKMFGTHAKIASLYANFSEVHGIGLASETNEKITVDLEQAYKLIEEDSSKDRYNHLENIEGESEEERSKRLYKMGIKERHDTLTYRTEYKCSKCGDVGRHYLRSVNSYSTCYSCRNPLTLNYAHPESTEDNLLPNEDFTYFIGK